MSKQIQRGFTLIELIVVMALMATIMAIAAPNISEMLANFRLSNSASALISDLNLARSEAIKSGKPVIILCQGAPCSETPINWAGGWVICYSDNDTSCNASTAQRPNPIRTAAALPIGQFISTDTRRVPFFANGVTDTLGVVFFQAGAKNITTKRDVAVTPSGSITSLEK
jgi:type IV fimbrial biogenesis protein FimT